MMRAVLTTIVLVTFTGGASAQAQNTTFFQYDVLGNLKEIKNGLGLTTKHDYDALSRRTRTTDPGAAGGAFTDYEYDLRDQLIRVTDARKVVTEFAIDGLGNLTSTTSTDTGASVNQHDAAGNVKVSTDAKLQQTRYDYDEIDRIKQITYHDGATVGFVYDQGANGIGQLTQITDISGGISYAYDSFGRMQSETRVIAGTPYITGYRYDEAGRLAGIDYPTGRAINYGYDDQGRIRKISTVQGGTASDIITDVSYMPFGPVKSVTFGNGRTQARAYDLDGRMTSFTLASQSMKIEYDAASRIKLIADAANPLAKTDFGYDVMNRLTNVQTPGSAQVYEYDEVGNRKKKTNGGTATSYGYGGPGNRLTQVGAQVIVSDQNGSTTDKGNATFAYDVRGRMVSADTAIGKVHYTINSLGQRVRKVTPTGTTVFHYDVAGKLIAETTHVGSSVTVQEHVYLGDIPVAVLK